MNVATPSIANPSTLTQGQSSISQSAAEWVERLSWHDIPAEVIDGTKLRILDVLGVMLAASPAPVITQVRSAAAECDPGTGGFILGSSGELSLSAAALVNGAMTALLEFDDTHIETAIHPTAAPVSVGVPLSISRRLAGTQLITAVLAGSELTCRLGLIGPRFHELRFHPTGIFGIFGAVYTMAKLMDLDANTIVNAIGLSGSLAAGSMASWEDGSSAKSLQVGLAASSAVKAVTLARHGLTGSSGVFESHFGFFKAHVQSSHDKLRFDAFAGDLGQTWESLNIASKAYPSAFTIHPFVDAAFALKAAHRFAPEDILEVICGVSEFTALGVCEPRSEKLRPKTTWHARISLQHMVAETLVTGIMDKTSFSEANLQDPRINAVTDKVICVVDPSQTERSQSGGSVRIRLRDGRDIVHEVEHMRGTRGNPISQADYIKKFMANADGVIGPQVVQEFIERTLNLEREQNVGDLFGLLAR